MLTFPLEKDEAGRHVWLVMHHKSSLYPQKPTSKERQRMRHSLLEDMNSIAKLCNHCKEHIRDYLKKNHLDAALDSREKLSEYICNFHNHVNSRNGKEVVDCKLILGDKKPCKDCQTEVKKDSDGLKGSFDRFKEASVKIFHSLCDRYKLPYPTIKFHECPTESTASCTSFWVDQRTNDVIEKPIVYLHPNLFGLRTIVHEFMHYIKQMSKDTIGGFDEETVEKDAQAILNSEFPYDKLDGNDLRNYAVPTQQQVVVKKDIYSHSKLSSFPIASRIFDKHLKNVKRRDLGLQNEEGDLVWDMIYGITGGKEEGTTEIIPEANRLKRGEEDRTVLSFLDGIYAPFAGLFGMRAADMNKTTTPDIISNAAIALARSNMSSIGSLLFTTITSLGIFGALAFGKHGLSYGDKLLMNSFGSQLLWSGIEYARPDYKEEVFEEATVLGEAVSTQNWGVVPKIIFGDTIIGSMVGIGETSQISPLSSARNIQRSSISRTGSGGIGGSRASSVRNLQRAGYEYIPPAGAAATMDVPTGAAHAGGQVTGRGAGPVYKAAGAGPSTAYNEGPVEVEIPSDIEEEYVESAFGSHVSDGSQYYPGPTGIITNDPSKKRNTIRDVFENDPYYNNFSDEYYEDGNVY